MSQLMRAPCDEQEGRVSTVAVVIPAYNAMRYLPLTLQSVLTQTYSDFDVIIVNDGSQDDIETWYQNLSESIRAKVRLLSQEKQGTSRARNAGIAQTKSPYVAFMDADDIWLPEKLEQQMAFMEAHPETSLVCSWAAVINEQGQLLGRVYAGRLQREVWAGLVERNVVVTSSVLVRRQCLAEVGGFDTTLFAYVEDKDLWLRVARSHQIHLIPDILIHNRRHGDNTSKRWVEMEEASYKVIDKALASPPQNFSAAQIHQLRQRSYAELNRHMAWKPLQTKEVEVAAALKYLLKAWRFRPVMLLSKESLKLMFVMLALTIVGAQRYRQWLHRVARVRRWLSQVKMGSWSVLRFQRSSSL